MNTVEPIYQERRKATFYSCPIESLQEKTSKNPGKKGKKWSIEKLMDKAGGVSQLVVLLPGQNCTEKNETKIANQITQRLLESHYFWRLELTCQVLLSEVFLNKVLRVLPDNSLSFVLENGKIDRGNTLAILPNLDLVMNLEKSTYEQLGLVGKLIPVPKDSFATPRYIVRFSLLKSSLTPKIRRRLEFALCNERVTPLSLLFASLNDIDVSAWPSEVKYTRLAPSAVPSLLSDVRIPDFSALLSVLTDPPSVPSNSLFDDISFELLNWTGLMLCQLPSGPHHVHNTTTSFISNLDFDSLPFLPHSSHSSCHILRFSSLFLPSQITSTLQHCLQLLLQHDHIPYFILTSSSFRDFPLSTFNFIFFLTRSRLYIFSTPNATLL